MNRQWLMLAIGLFFSHLINAQEKNNPYFQQQVDYKINVSLNDKEHLLTATEELKYTNNSPDTLSELLFHLWPNAYSTNSTAFAKQQIRLKNSRFYFDKKENYGFLNDIHFLSGKDTLLYAYLTPDIDVCKIRLKKKLSPGASVDLQIPFSVYLPRTYSRLGHIGQSYQITQWYPKPAVYDREGWHAMPYLDEGEFYSEFGSFKVKITVPANYVVGATGVLQNKEEKNWLKDRLKDSIPLTDKIISAETFKTLTFEQDNIHDFAWFADKYYNVAQDSVKLESGKVVQVWFYYTSDWTRFKESALRDLKDAVYWYSKWVGEYPYTSATAVTGPLGAGAGMEYPMITITDPFAIIHEVGHNWFYGILGSNERDYGWMDEGLNSYIENRVFEFQSERREKQKEEARKDSIKSGFEVEPKKKLKERRRELTVSLSMESLPYTAMRSRAFAEPVQLHSDKYYEFNYGMSLYMNPPLFFGFLRSYLGEKVFDKCFHQYYDDWKFKHPQPEDMRQSFEKASGKDLGWFFNDLIKTTDQVDIGIKSLIEDGNKYKLVLRNLGKVRIPVNVKVFGEGKKALDEFWVEPFEGVDTVLIPLSDFKNIKINIVEQNLDLSPNNDYIARRGIKKIKTLKFKFLTGVDSAQRCEEYFMPIAGYNASNGLMPGIALYNSSPGSKKAEYIIAPMYSFNAQEVTGIAGVNFKWNGKQSLVRNNLQFGIQRFTQTKADIIFNHNSYQLLMGKKFNRDVKLSNYWLPRQFPSVGAPLSKGSTFGHKIEYELTRNDALNHIKIKPSIEYIGEESRPQVGGFTGVKAYRQGAIRYNLEVLYARQLLKKSWTKLRLFAGSQLYAGTYFDYGIDGKVDYAMEYYAIDRFGQGIAAGRQTNEEEGGMRQMVGSRARSLLAINLTTGIPKTPFSIFGDWTRANGTVSFYDAGISIVFVDDFLGLHFPIYGSGYASGKPADFEDFTNNVRFTLKWRLRPIEQIVRDVMLH